VPRGLKPAREHCKTADKPVILGLALCAALTEPRNVTLSRHDGFGLDVSPKILIRLLMLSDSCIKIKEAEKW